MKIKLLTLALAFCSACVFAQEVKVRGALKKIMHEGDISSKISLTELKDVQNLYGLGAVANLKGEILVWDSVPYSSFVENDSLKTRKSFEIGATLFVHTEVEDWKEVSFPDSVETYEQFESFLKKLTEKEPFPFLVKGKIPLVKWHVIDWKDGDTEHTHHKHKTSGANGTLENVEAEILGFYSTKHKKVFTHYYNTTHLHIKFPKENFVAHVDDIKFGKDLKFYLPKD